MTRRSRSSVRGRGGPTDERGRGTPSRARIATLQDACRLSLDRTRFFGNLPTSICGRAQLHARRHSGRASVVTTTHGERRGLGGLRPDRCTQQGSTSPSDRRCEFDHCWQGPIPIRKGRYGAVAVHSRACSWQAAVAGTLGHPYLAFGHRPRAIGWGFLRPDAGFRQVGHPYGQGRGRDRDRALTASDHVLRFPCWYDTFPRCSYKLDLPRQRSPWMPFPGLHHAHRSVDEPVSQALLFAR